MTTGPRIAVVDADTLLYQIALSAEMCARKQGADGEDLWFQVRDLNSCWREFTVRLEGKLDQVEADDCIICLSDRRTFRHDLYPGYKANRAKTRRPPMMVELREACQERSAFRVLSIPRLEADDVAGITGTSLRAAGRDAVILSEDKDLLSIPGVLHRKDRTFEVTLEEADRAHLYQTLVGDYTDGYPGCPGIGPKRANVILNEGARDGNLWAAVEAAFVTRAPATGQDDALTMARLARILRDTDWDRDKGEPILWIPTSTPREGTSRGR